MRASENDLVLLEKLGEGSYASVYKGKRKSKLYKKGGENSEELVAVKILSLESMDGASPTAVREIGLNFELGRHPQLVGLLEVVKAESKLMLVFEFMEQDLSHFISKQAGNPISPSLIKSFMRDLLTGLDHCHTHRVLHRDIKPQNLLLDQEFHLKLGDFGLARKFGRGWGVPFTDRVITQWYRPPELLLGASKYSGKVDIWSAGCVMAEIYLGRPLFHQMGSEDSDQLNAIFRTMGTPNPSAWPNLPSYPRWDPGLFAYHPPTPITTLVSGIDPLAADFLSKLLCYNPKRRPNASQALTHPYLLP